MLNIVWLKRDLRLRDHEPLQQAILQEKPLLLLYIFEPSILNYPDWSDRHAQFIYHSIQAMNQELVKYKIKINIFYGEAVEVFDFLKNHIGIDTVFSHQETGNKKTYDRDLDLIQFFADKKIAWNEYQQNGIWRGLKNRQNWDENWITKMSEPQSYPNWERLKTASVEIPENLTLPRKLQKIYSDYSKEFQPAGEHYAWRYLHSFIEKRGRGYSRNLSKPQESRYTSGRTSPYLAWGNLSTKQVYQFYLEHLEKSFFKRDLQNFRSRLQWRCHFMQRFEMEDRMEFENLNPVYDDLEYAENPEHLEAWQKGKTGFPLIDASMRCVKATGYLNFRMRALLVSFLTHLLWQHWSKGTRYLAQQFLDYEPGIHYCQFQMQAGVQGINTIRIYNPTKQAKEKDPEGAFIKKWVPELKNTPKELIHEPFKMSEEEQEKYNCQIGVDYPFPIIDLKPSMKHAQTQLWSKLKSSENKKAIQKILSKHITPANEGKLSN